MKNLLKSTSVAVFVGSVGLVRARISLREASYDYFRVSLAHTKHPCTCTQHIVHPTEGSPGHSKFMLTAFSSHNEQEEIEVEVRGSMTEKCVY